MDLKEKIEIFLKRSIVDELYNVSTADNQRYFQEKQYQKETILLVKRKKMFTWEAWNEYFLKRKGYKK